MDGLDQQAVANRLLDAVYPQLDENTQELVDIMVEDHQWSEVVAGLTNAAKVLGLKVSVTTA